MLDLEEACGARDGIADTLASIDRGDLEATRTQRAYLEGARDTLDAVLEDPEPPVPPI